MKLNIILFFICLNTFCQDTNLSKKELIKILKENNSKKWSTCNRDSLFFKSDSIYFYGNYCESECIETIEWRFESSKSFWQPTFYHSREYGTARSPIMTEKDHYRLKIEEYKNQTFFKIYNKKILNATFLVFSAGYDSKTSCNKLILKRVK